MAHLSVALNNLGIKVHLKNEKYFQLNLNDFLLFFIHRNYR